MFLLLSYLIVVYVRRKWFLKESWWDRRSIHHSHWLISRVSLLLLLSVECNDAVHRYASFDCEIRRFWLVSSFSCCFFENSRLYTTLTCLFRWEKISFTLLICCYFRERYTSFLLTTSTSFVTSSRFRRQQLFLEKTRISW